MPIVRRAVFDYVRIWNQHRIQAQKDRPNYIPGKPTFLYNFADVARYGKPVDDRLFSELQADMQGWDKLHRYSPTSWLFIFYCHRTMRTVIAQ